MASTRAKKKTGASRAKKPAARRKTAKASARKASSRSAATRGKPATAKSASRKTSARATVTRGKPVKAKTKRATARASSSRGGKDVIGEGNYTAARKFRKDQTNFVQRNKSRIAKLGKQAERDLEGPEGDELRKAEAEGRSHAHE